MQGRSFLYTSLPAAVTPFTVQINLELYHNPMCHGTLLHSWGGRCFCTPLHFHVRQAWVSILAYLNFEARMSGIWKVPSEPGTGLSAQSVATIVIIIASWLSPREAPGYRDEPPWKRSTICPLSSHSLAHGHVTREAGL